MAKKVKGADMSVPADKLKSIQSEEGGPGKYMTKKEVEGPGRSMGYTQNFGPARVNGYSKGAAKINSIMGKGPAQGELDMEKLKKFAISKGEAVTKSNEAKKDQEMITRSAGQYADSLNQVAEGNDAAAANMYGSGLTFGNVAGGSQAPNSTSMLKTGGVSPDSSKAVIFPPSTRELQKTAGNKLLDEYNAQ